MRVVVDTREQAPWTFSGQSVEVVRSKLTAGDYSLVGLEDRVAIERKSLSDWVGTVMRDRRRFYRELERLRALEFRCVLIEASVRQIAEGCYRSAASPRAVMGFLAEVAVAQSVPVYAGGSRAECQVLAAALLRAAWRRFDSVDRVQVGQPP